MRLGATVACLILAGCSDPPAPSTTRSIVVSVEGCTSPVAVGWSSECERMDPIGEWAQRAVVIPSGGTTRLMVPTAPGTCIRSVNVVDESSDLLGGLAYGQCHGAVPVNGDALTLHFEAYEEFIEDGAICLPNGIAVRSMTAARYACVLRHGSTPSRTVVGVGPGVDASDFEPYDFVDVGTTPSDVERTIGGLLNAVLRVGANPEEMALVGLEHGSAAMLQAVQTTPLRRLVLVRPTFIDPDLDLRDRNGVVSRADAAMSRLALAVGADDPWADWARLFGLPLPFDDTGNIDPQAWATWQARSPLRWLEAHASEMTIAVIGDPALEARLRAAGARIVTLVDETKLEPMWPALPNP